MCPHHSDQMSQRPQVSRIALWRCSLNVFVFVIVFVFVFVFVIVFFWVRSCPLITLIKCLKGHKSLGSLCCCVFQKVPYWVSESVTRSPIELSAGQLKIQTYHFLTAYSCKTYYCPPNHQIINKIILKIMSTTSMNDHLHVFVKACLVILIQTDKTSNMTTACFA